MVPGAEKALVLFVPQGKRKHAPQPGQHPLAPLLVAVQQHLGVRVVGGKHVPRLCQFPPQLHKIIDLAVEHNGQGLILVEHGLGAARKVDDREPPVPQGHAVGVIFARAVRPPVGNGGGHGLQDLLFIASVAGKACNSTHMLSFPFPVGGFSQKGAKPQYVVYYTTILPSLKGGRPV